MISRRTSSVPKEDIVFPRLLYCDLRCSKTYCWRSHSCPLRSQVLPGSFSALPGFPPALPVTLKAGRNALQGSDTLLKLTHLSLNSTFSQTLLEASSDWNTFCWCFWPLDNPREQHVCSDLLDKTNIHVLHTLGVDSICNQFWQYPLCSVYLHWQPDGLHQLLLGLVKDLLHWLLKIQKARNIKDQFDHWFTLVQYYSGLHCFSKPFNSLKSVSWEGKEIWGMIRTLAVNYTPILDYSKNNGKTVAETASDEIGMGAVQALCECSLLLSQQNNSNLFLTVLDNELKPCYKMKGAFHKRIILKSATINMDELVTRESHQ